MKPSLDINPNDISLDNINNTSMNQSLILDTSQKVRVHTLKLYTLFTIYNFY